MRILFIVILLSTLFTACSQVNKFTSYQTQYLYRGSNKASELDTTIKKLDLLFESGFKDSIIVKFGNKLIAKDYMLTDKNTSFTGKFYTIDYSDNKKRDAIIVCSLTRKQTIKINVKEGFRFIELAHYNGQWQVIYSNVSPIFE